MKKGQSFRMELINKSLTYEMHTKKNESKTLIQVHIHECKQLTDLSALK